MFEITVDFHDSTSPRKIRFVNFTDLALYLERVPNSLGYYASQNVTIDIRTVSSDKNTDPLF